MTITNVDGRRIETIEVRRHTESDEDEAVNAAEAVMGLEGEAEPKCLPWANATLSGIE